MAGGTWGTLAVATAAIVLRCAEATITVEDSTYRDFQQDISMELCFLRYLLG